MAKHIQLINFHLSTLLILYTLTTYTSATDTISPNQTLHDGETIVSSQQTFELGFFSPKNSTNRYLGIWYKRISTGTVIWTANRNTPLTNSTGQLSLTVDGTLTILNNATGVIIWTSVNTSSPSVKNPVSQLLDTGNFLVREEEETGDINIDSNIIWQSFDYPTDTFVPGMKFGKNFVTGRETHFTSWKGESDPSVGDYTVWLDTQGYPQMVVREREVIEYRAGPWNGEKFSGEPNLRSSSVYKFGFTLNEREMYYYFELLSSSVITRVVIQATGGFERLLWIENRQEWLLYLTPQTDNCDRYKLCGAFGSCNINNSPACGCLKGFEPTSPDQWNVADWSQGCRRSTPLDCGVEVGFRRYSGVKLPDTQESWFNQTMNLDECERFCKRNCSCTAYTTQNISGDGSGCLLWFGELMDIRTFAENGQDLFIKMPASELAKDKSSGAKKLKIFLPLISVLLVILVSMCIFYQFKKSRQSGTLEKDDEYDASNKNSKDDLELPLIDFVILRKATANFADYNKLGEGGFGPVYKGVMEDGQEVAVKRLSRTSTQGLKEFKNEVITISKLQHRNLVRLLGCSIKGAEKMLVYEYMPNKSLDKFVFDKKPSKVLDWPTRFHIIKGIARGLLYLHQDSRLRIIHRDLKVSNILLDHDMNPKISDFGMARSFGGNQTEANTNRVVGTYGYMAPEYAADGLFSIKSDVFSFGVLVLEIVSGKRNRGFSHKDHNNNLLGHAWGLHKDDKPLELVATSLNVSINLPEVIRSIHVGLLCVQQRPEDRPNMSSVVLMFGSEGELLPPKPPGFFYEKEKTTTENSSSSGTYGTSSTTELTATMLKVK